VRPRSHTSRHARSGAGRKSGALRDALEVFYVYKSLFETSPADMPASQVAQMMRAMTELVGRDLAGCGINLLVDVLYAVIDPRVRYD
jgi:hypothetical protein